MGFLSKGKQAIAKYGHDFLQVVKEIRKKTSQNRLVI